MNVRFFSQSGLYLQGMMRDPGAILQPRTDTEDANQNRLSTTAHIIERGMINNASNRRIMNEAD